MKTHLSRRVLLGFALAFSLACASCVQDSAEPGAVTLIDPPPGGTAFKPVGLFLGHSCGTLDCHGQVGRNLRIYSQNGLRLSPTDVPGGNPTTAAELDADYQSAVSLEPEIMSEVVEQGGADPGRLTLVRKPFGIEHHKGGTVIEEGDPQAYCLLSWLTGKVDTVNCAKAKDLW
jgi:hypothetical protein